MKIQKHFACFHYVFPSKSNPVYRSELKLITQFHNHDQSKISNFAAGHNRCLFYSLKFLKYYCLSSFINNGPFYLLPNPPYPACGPVS